MSWLNQCEGYRDDMKLCKRGYCSAKAKYDVYPSAYANLYASSVCQGKAADYSGQIYADAAYTQRLVQNSEPNDLQRWVQEKWVNVCEPDYPPCGRKTASVQNYPYCRPSVRVDSKTPTTASELSLTEIEQLCTQKNINPYNRVYINN